jgi:hypothetical protein
MKYLVPLLSLLVAGCAAQAIKEKMTAEMGQPVSRVIEKLGFPTEERTIAGRHVYVWSTSNFVEGTNYRCQIRAIVDEKNNVIAWDNEGNEGGCRAFMSRLSQ